MKLGLVAAALAAIALMGCATSGTTTTVARQRSGPRAFSDDGVDFAKMAQVDQVARARGVDVIWVNPPMSRR